MKHCLLLVSIFLFMTNLAFAYAPEVGDLQSSQNLSMSTQIADSSSDIARCFNANMRTGADYMAVLSGCMKTARLNAPEPINQVVADRSSNIARCFNAGVRTGVDYIALLAGCMETAAIDQFSDQDLQYAEVENSSGGTQVSF